MSEEELININGIREDLYQAMQIGDITLNSKHSQELYDFMNYQDKEIERLNNIINEFDKWLLGEQMMFYRGSDNERLIRFGETRNKWLELKGSDKE